jgi:hypothetical protein
VDQAKSVPFRRAPHPADAAQERALIEIDAAIALVTRGTAIRIALAGLAITDAVGSVAAAHAQAAGVRLHVERRGGGRAATSMIVGPVI